MYPDGLRRPRLKAHLVVRVVAPDKVFLLSETGHHLVRGEAAAAIAPLLDGRRTVPEIAAAVASEVSLPECLFALAKFHRFGHVVDGAPEADVRRTAAWDARGIDPGAASVALRVAEAGLIAVGDVDLSGPRDALVASGVRVGAEHGDITIVVTDDYLNPRLGDFGDRPWLLAKPVGDEIWLGPFFRPGVTGCWYCLRERLSGNRPVARYLNHTDPGPLRTSVAALPHTTGVAAHLIAGAAVTALTTGGLPALEGVLVSYDLVGLTSERHPLIRQPHCPSCGDPALLRPCPRVRLVSRPAQSRDGGYRVEAPEATFRRLEKHVDRLLGAVTSLRQLSDVDLAPSYVAGHNFALNTNNIDGLRRTLRGQSGGKGRTDVQARVSAVCEAIERYCGVWSPGRQTTVGSYAELGPQKAVAVEDLLLFSADQYANRQSFNREGAGRLHHVPEPYHHARPIEWTSAWSLTHDRERLLPAAFTWFGHPELTAYPFCIADSNGNAAGNTLEEAILQGFCELVERDSVALWWYNHVRRPAVDLGSLRSQYVDALRSYYADLGRELWMLDLTTDLGVPAFAAVSRRTDHPVEDVLVAFGAHLDPRTAALRALTELNQFLPAVATREADGGTRYLEDDPSTLDWWHTTRVAAQPWLLPDPDAAPVSVDMTELSGDLAEQVRRCVDLAANAGLEVIVCDQTRPDIELHVVKVVVPGMRHFWRRVAPGRLYDVPVRLGWIDKPVAEGDLNPVSVFF
ncbi:TOMM precursor leader peptide-binding protein [Lentzea sp. PSKA42]|uniref:TOMM leader peptide-binding protein n=1 Tax=Lentzea indica TaxID=2604800 RepID=A0ABX1FRS5_9PSEU|nr:TOMM precursor leader peptide-binding protein [Lentzea indica]NKE61452.1 TOMM precursor leader peptide-binding protein [Lentzea indica]